MADFIGSVPHGAAVSPGIASLMRGEAEDRSAAEVGRGRGARLRRGGSGAGLSIGLQADWVATAASPSCGSARRAAAAAPGKPRGLSAEAKWQGLGPQQSLTEKEFVRLQAILTTLPKHVVIPSGTSMPLPDEAQADLVEAALLQACQMYPRYEKELGRLLLVHVGEDLLIFADHKTRRLFTALRGTNPLKARDLADDARVALGYPPARADDAICSYSRIRRQFSVYETYGCGHSLGGSVLHELACRVGKDPSLAFTRVDVFNAGGSPLQQPAVALWRTRFFAHCVEGDMVSLFYEPPGGNGCGAQVIVHKEDPRFGKHRMGNFLPRQRSCPDLKVAHGRPEPGAECAIS